MARARIRAQDRPANLADYARTADSFTWDQAESAFTFAASGRVNLAWEALDRWALNDLARKRTALTWEGPTGPETYSFARASALVGRWAAVLAGQGLGPGRRLAIMLPPCPEVVWAMLAAAKLGAVWCAWPSVLSRREAAERLAALGPAVILAAAESAAGLEPGSLPDGARLLWLGGPPGPLSGRESAVEPLLETAVAHYEPHWLGLGDPLCVIFNSGGDGPPVGVVHAQRAMIGWRTSARWVLDLGTESRLWTQADPSSVLGQVYGAVAAWLCGAGVLGFSADPPPALAFDMLMEHQITTWYTSPGAVQGFMAAEDELPPRPKLPDLAHVATVGEGLTPPQFFWLRNRLDLAPHDTWWSVETGMILLANFPSLDIKLGSVGRPLPGAQIAVVDREGRERSFLDVGELMVRPGWPAMPLGILGEDDRWRAHLSMPGWFATGDLAIVDEDGYIYLQGRRDDLVRGRGRLVGPWELERTLNDHPDVAAAAAVPLAGEPGLARFQVFAVARPGRSGDLVRALLDHCRAELAADVAVAGLELVESLPVNGDGRLLRRALRAMSLGLPLGEVTGLTAD